MIRRFLILTLFVCGCTTTNNWSMDGIATGNSSFDSKRLRYHSTQAYPPLQFEIVRMGEQIEAFLSLTHFRLSEDNVKIIFTVEDQTFEDLVAVHEGRMRVRLSTEVTQKIIQALQDGKKVAILLDGFEETLDPTQFSSSFSKFANEGSFFQNLFKGPLE